MSRPEGSSDFYNEYGQIKDAKAAQELAGIESSEGKGAALDREHEMLAGQHDLNPHAQPDGNLESAGINASVEMNGTKTRQEVQDILDRYRDRLFAGFNDAQGPHFMLMGLGSDYLGEEKLGNEELGKRKDSIVSDANQVIDKSMAILQEIRDGQINNVKHLETALKEIDDLLQKVISEAKELLAALPETPQNERAIRFLKYISNTYPELHENFYFAITKEHPDKKADLQDEITSTINPVLHIEHANASVSGQHRRFYYVLMNRDLEGGWSTEVGRDAMQAEKELSEKYDGSFTKYLEDLGFQTKFNFPSSVELQQTIWRIIENETVLKYFFEAINKGRKSGSTENLNGFIEFGVDGEAGNRYLTIKYPVDAKAKNEEQAKSSLSLPEEGDEKWVPYSRKLAFDRIGREYHEPFKPNYLTVDGKTIAEVKVAFE